MPDLTVRPALLAERPALIAVQRRAALANPGDRDMLLQHPEMIDTPEELFRSGNVLVAERGGRALGFAALDFWENGDAELDGLFVDPDAWHQGIGRVLVEACIARARARRAGMLHVVGNPHAEGFYLRLGFRLIERRKLQLGTGLMMWMELVADPH